MTEKNDSAQACPWSLTLADGEVAKCVLDEDHRPLVFYPHHLPDRSITHRNPLVLEGKITGRDGLLSPRTHLSFWLSLERNKYADVKYADGTETRTELVNNMMEEGFSDRWLDFAQNYIKRATIFGADSEKGRQAMGKAVVTLLHTLETAIMVHGPMPKPGVPSGEIEEWS